MSSKPVFGRARRVATAFACFAAVATTGLIGSALWSDWAQAQGDQTKVSAKGRVVGGHNLINSVWSEAADPNNHRYTFRQPSPTVGSRAKKLSAYLPKELCVAALGAGASPAGAPVQVHISGGRCSPSTVVVPVGQNVQFVNDDPYAHKLYDVKGDKGGLGPEETKQGKQRIWKPPATGTYEIRDKLSPSVRIWIVVKENVVASGYPSRKNEYVVPGLTEGEYELQAFFEGKPVGKPLKVELRGAPDVQQISAPLVVSDKKDKK